MNGMTETLTGTEKVAFRPRELKQLLDTHEVQKVANKPEIKLHNQFPDRREVKAEGISFGIQMADETSSEQMWETTPAGQQVRVECDIWLKTGNPPEQATRYVYSADTRKWYFSTSHESEYNNETGIRTWKKMTDLAEASDNLVRVQVENRLNRALVDGKGSHGKEINKDKEFDLDALNAYVDNNTDFKVYTKRPEVPIYQAFPDIRSITKGEGENAMHIAVQRSNDESTIKKEVSTPDGQTNVLAEVWVQKGKPPTNTSRFVFAGNGNVYVSSADKWHLDENGVRTWDNLSAFQKADSDFVKTNLESAFVQVSSN